MEETGSFLQYLTKNGEIMFTIGTSIVGVFALIATMTPNSSDNVIADFLLKTINLLGANFGKAKNDPSVK